MVLRQSLTIGTCLWTGADDTNLTATIINYDLHLAMTEVPWCQQTAHPHPGTLCILCGDTKLVSPYRIHNIAHQHVSKHDVLAQCWVNGGSAS